MLESGASPYPMPPSPVNLWVPSPSAVQETLPDTPTVSPMPQPTSFVYLTQAGDTLSALSLRFQVPVEAIHSASPISSTGLLKAGQLLYLPVGALSGEPNQPLLPYSELVYSPTASFFDVQAYLQQAGGFLKSHSEYLRSTGWTSAADIISRVGREYSINPRLLLALLEYECGCVLGEVKTGVDPQFLLGIPTDCYKGLYLQVEWAASALSQGYYGWRSGALTQFPYANGLLARPFPALNAGSVALAYYFARKNLVTGGSGLSWRRAINERVGFPSLYVRMFGDPWVRAQAVEPLLPDDLSQPPLRLPFEAGALWSYSSGPHPAWGKEGALAALDFAPAVPVSGCVQSDAWVVAMADGLIVRSGYGVVVQEVHVDGAASSMDGLEETGWAILYLHIESRGRVPQGVYLRAGERIGHPSCEGGRANGTHVHLARKYNGEWIPADGALPFVLSGWVAHVGVAAYQGTLTRGDRTVIAHPNGSRETLITLSEDDT